MCRALADGGYVAVTIEGLAAEAQVSKQTIYRWWPSKAAVLGEALLEGHLPGGEVDVAMTDDLRADLRELLSRMSAQRGDAAQVEVARALIAVTATDAELGLALNERLAAPIRAWVSERISRAQDAGDVRADVNGAALADQFIAQASYAALIGRTLDAEAVDAAVDVLLRGIAEKA